MNSPKRLSPDVRADEKLRAPAPSFLHTKERSLRSYSFRGLLREFLMRSTDMSKIAVIAHKYKTFGGGLQELRRLLAEEGIRKPLWIEIRRSSEAPRAVKRCLKRGADLLLLWGGDGTIQQCIDAVVSARAGGKVDLGILPAGTANLLACNL